MSFNLGNLGNGVCPPEKIDMLRLVLKLFELQQFCRTQNMDEWQHLESCCCSYMAQIGRYLRFGRWDDLKVMD